MQPYKKRYWATILVNLMGILLGWVLRGTTQLVLFKCVRHTIDKCDGYLCLDKCSGVPLAGFTVFLMMLSFMEVYVLSKKHEKIFSNFNKCVSCSLPGTAFLKFSVTFKVSDRAANSLLWHKVHRVTCATWV